MVRTEDDHWSSKTEYGPDHAQSERWQRTGPRARIKVFVEGDDPLDVQLLTPLQSIPKVWQVLLHVCEIDRLDLHKQVLLFLQDIVVD